MKALMEKGNLNYGIFHNFYLRKQRFKAKVLAEAETKRKNAKVAAKSYYFEIKMLSKCILPLHQFN